MKAESMLLPYLIPAWMIQYDPQLSSAAFSEAEDLVVMTASVEYEGASQLRTEEAMKANFLGKVECCCTLSVHLLQPVWPWFCTSVM